MFHSRFSDTESCFLIVSAPGIVGYTISYRSYDTTIKITRTMHVNKSPYGNDEKKIILKKNSREKVFLKHTASFLFFYFLIRQLYYIRVYTRSIGFLIKKFFLIAKVSRNLKFRTNVYRILCAVISIRISGRRFIQNDRKSTGR